MSDPSAEADRLSSALRARGYAVFDVPLSLLMTRVAVQRPALILLDIDAEAALETAQRLRELPGGGAIPLIFFGDPSRTLAACGEALRRLGAAVFARPLEVGAVVEKVESLASPSLGQVEPEPLSSSSPPGPNPEAPGPGPNYAGSSPPGAPASPSHERNEREQSGRASAPPPMRAFESSRPVAPQSPAAQLPLPSLSPEVEQLLQMAEQQQAGAEGAAGSPWYTAPSHPPSHPPSPEDEVDAVLPAEVLSALDESIEDDQDELDSEADLATGGRKKSTTVDAGSSAGRSLAAQSVPDPSAGPASSRHSLRDAQGPPASHTSPFSQGAPSAGLSAAVRTSAEPIPLISASRMARSHPTEVLGGPPEHTPVTTRERASSASSPATEAASPHAAPSPSDGVMPLARPSLLMAPTTSLLQAPPSLPAPPPLPSLIPRQQTYPAAPPGPVVPPRSLTAPGVPLGSVQGTSHAASSSATAHAAHTRDTSRPPPRARDTSPPPRARDTSRPPPRARDTSPPPRARDTSRPPPRARDTSRPPPPAASPGIPEVLGPEDAIRAVAMCIQQRATGAICIDSAEGVRRILLRDGDVVTASSGIDEESLVGFLAARGDLPREVVPQLLGKIPAFGRLAASALSAKGHITQDQLWPVLRAHAEWIVGNALLTQRGTAAFELEPPGRLKAEPSVFGGATGSETLVEVVKRVIPPSLAVARIGGPTGILVEGSRWELLSECALADPLLLWLERAKGTSVAEALADVPVSDVEPVLYALVELGILTRVRAEDELPDAPVADRGKGTTAHADPIDAQALRAQVATRLQLVQEADYFTLLGVPRTATSYEVHRAYVDLRKAFSPHRTLTAATADLADELHLILEVLDEAHEVLRDTARRDRYRRAIEGDPPR